MLQRKIYQNIVDFLLKQPKKVLIIEGARQVGKTYIIRQIGNEKFSSFVEINMLEDKMFSKQFENLRSIDDFYLRLSSVAGQKLKERDTLVFIDEIQAYPELITLLKFLNDDGKYRYIASGSLLGITLSNITSIPIGTIEIMKMYPLDFEEFLVANGVGNEYIDYIKKKIIDNETIEEKDHIKMMDLFKKYLLIGGMPDVVNQYLNDINIVEIRKTQKTIIDLYKTDCSQYDKENKLKIQRLYEVIPSNMENKKKRVEFNNIEQKIGKTKSDYQEEFDYLISSGIALEVKSVSEPRFPLLQSTIKSLLKLYMNDVGLLTCLLYESNISPIMDDINSINLGSVYENVVATELKAHGKELYYYDNKKTGEVDFLVDDYNALSIVPIEVKSGKNYYVHSAINNLLKINNYNMGCGLVFNNKKDIEEKNKVKYMPIYALMVV